MTLAVPQQQEQLVEAWNEAAAELNAIPLVLEHVRYAAALKFIASLPSEARILEAGCGGGRILRTLAALGYHNLTGVEISQARLDYIRMAGPPEAQLVCSDRVEFPDAAFDAVVTAGVIEHVEEPSQWLAELTRVTRPGGLISITTDTYMWRWLRQLGLYRTIQPLDEPIWPRTFIAWAEAAGLELAGCGAFVSVPEQRWYFVRQLKRLLSLRRWWRKLSGQAGRKPAAPPAASRTLVPADETECIIKAMQAFPLSERQDLQGCVWSWECYYWFRKPA